MLRIKERVEEKEGIPPSQQRYQEWNPVIDLDKYININEFNRLIFGGKQM